MGPRGIAVGWVACVTALFVAATGLGAQTFKVTLGSSVSSAPVTGRLFVFFTQDAKDEPRVQAGSYTGSVPLFGVDVGQLRPGASAEIDLKTLGFPYASLADMPPGDYYIQALIEPYTRFARADGHVIWVHNDQWEGQRFNQSPGDLTTEVGHIHWDPQNHVRSCSTPVGAHVTRDTKLRVRPMPYDAGSSGARQPSQWRRPPRPGSGTNRVGNQMAARERHRLLGRPTSLACLI
jgi:hypothetical protein